MLWLGGGLGWTPSETYAASLWEIAAAVEGHNAAHASDDEGPPAMSDAEHDALIAFHMQTINKPRNRDTAHHGAKP